MSFQQLLNCPAVWPLSQSYPISYVTAVSWLPKGFLRNIYYCFANSLLLSLLQFFFSIMSFFFLATHIPAILISVRQQMFNLIINHSDNSQPAKQPHSHSYGQHKCYYDTSNNNTTTCCVVCACLQLRVINVNK